MQGGEISIAYDALVPQVPDDQVESHVYTQHEKIFTQRACSFASCPGHCNSSHSKIQRRNIANQPKYSFTFRFSGQQYTHRRMIMILIRYGCNQRSHLAPMSHQLPQVTDRPLGLTESSYTKQATISLVCYGRNYINAMYSIYFCHNVIGRHNSLTVKYYTT